MKLAALTTFFLLASAPALAVPVVFFGEDITPPDGATIPNSSAARAAFDAFFAGNVGVEDFEAATPGQMLPNEPPTRLIPQARFVGGFGTIFANFDQAGGVNTHALATSGSNTYADDEDTITVSFFSEPVNGIGFYGIDFTTGPLTMNVHFDDGAIEQFVVGQSLTRDSIFFWGIADAARAITSISGGTPLSGGPDFLNDTDDYVVGLLAVPEPGVLGLLGCGLAALGMVRRRAS